jgi:hypothetical protein
MSPRTVELYPCAPDQADALAERILNDRAASKWLQAALSSALRRDVVDAANDAELLLSVLLARVELSQQGGVR